MATKNTKRSRKKRRRKPDLMVPKLIIIVAAVLVVFEGKLVMTMVSQRSSATVQTSKETIVLSESEVTIENSGETKAASSNNNKTSAASVRSSAGDTLAGLPGLTSTGSNTDNGENSSNTVSEKLPTVSNPDSTAIVPKAAVPVDDSYFSDAVFIGDSRMEGFRNVSGITQGTFFTSVGMSLSGLINQPIIKYGDETITVAAAVSGGSYQKIYLMLGTNDLGEYDLEGFHDRFTSATQRLMELQPGAIFYVCSIIYVEEDKVTTGDYVNNTNVDKLNAILLQICEEQGYYYIDLNEILSNGYGSLVEGASSDGVHLYQSYCEQMLDYLKNHYITSDTSDSENESETESESEASA